MNRRIITLCALAALLVAALSIRTTSAAPHYAPPVNSPEITVTPTTSPEEAALPRKPAQGGQGEQAQAEGDQSASNSYSSVYLYPGWNFTYCADESITPYSWVLASVTELGSDGLPHPGAAHFQVGNVVPQSGYVWVYIYSDWGSELPAWVNCHLAN